MAKIATLNIGASRVVLAEYAVKGTGSPVLTAYGSASIAGLDWEAEGSVEAVLTPAVREAAAAAGIKPGTLYLALNGQMVFPRFTKFPSVQGEKLDELVRYEVEQEVPFPIDDIVFDYQLLGQTAEGDMAAMIVAAKLDQVSKVTDAVASVGFNPVVVDAGLGLPSHAAAAMEMGADAVLVNTAIAVASDPIAMARAFADAVDAGRRGRLAGPAGTFRHAVATSPLTAFLND